MTPQQATAQLVSQIIQQNPRGISVEELLKEMVNKSEEENTMLYLGADRSLREYIRSLENAGTVDVYKRNGQIIIKPAAQSRRRPARAA